MRRRIQAALLSLYAFWSISAQPIADRYTISTLAGTGVSQLTPALYSSQQLAFDASGNMYIADAGVHIVWKASPDGALRIFAGTGKAGFSGDGGKAVSAQLDTPRSVAVDKVGSVYIADSNNNRLRKVNADGTIQTVAGPGVSGVIGDGGPPTNARLNNPSGVALDSTGNIFIAESGNNRIRFIYNGVIQTIVSGAASAANLGDGGPAGNATLASPYGLAVDSRGILYISDVLNNRIRKVVPAANARDLAVAYQTGVITTAAGTGIAGSGTNQLNQPRAIALDSLNNLYIADTENSRIIMITTSGGFATVAGIGKAGYSGDNGEAKSAAIARPTGIATDGSGNIYIDDHDNKRIRKITSTGTIASFIPADTVSARSIPLIEPRGVALDNNGNLYIADLSGHAVYRTDLVTGITTRFAGTGSPGHNGDSGPAEQLALNSPWMVNVDQANNVYIADTNNHRILKVSPTGAAVTIAGTGAGGFTGDGSDATKARLLTPHWVQPDAFGNVYVADLGNNRIRRIAQDGTINTVAGGGSGGVPGYGGDGGSATLAQLNAPDSVTVDNLGNVYVGDTGNNRVRKLSPDGIIVTIAGNGGEEASGDGGPAEAAGMLVTGIALDATGSLYIADRRNNRIRKVDAAGVVTTIAGTGVAGATGDGAGALRAQLNLPASMTIDAQGVVYVADGGNGLVRKLTPASGLVGGVRNAASALFSPVAAGEVITITGTGLGPAEMSKFEIDDSGLLPTVLSGTRVLFDGIAAPLLSVQANEITAIIPYEIAGQPTTKLEMELSGVRTDLVTLPVGSAAPGIFAKVDGSIVNSDGTPNSASNPASRGSAIVLTCTGEGQTEPAGTNGLIAGENPPVPLQQVAVQIGGIDATIVSATGIPGLPAGFLQVTVQIPDAAPAGPVIPIALSIGGSRSQPGVTIAVD